MIDLVLCHTCVESMLFWYSVTLPMKPNSYKVPPVTVPCARYERIPAQRVFIQVLRSILY